MGDFLKHNDSPSKLVIAASGKDPSNQALVLPIKCVRSGWHERECQDSKTLPKSQINRLYNSISEVVLIKNSNNQKIKKFYLTNWWFCITM